MSQILRGEIYFADLNPSVGSEIAKIRPVLVISNNANNRYAATVTIVPITSSTEKAYPFEIMLRAGEGGLTVDSKAKANQIRTIDKRRLKERIGSLNEKKLTEVEQAILIPDVTHFFLKNQVKQGSRQHFSLGKELFLRQNRHCA